MRQGNAGPLRDERPALLTGQLGDLSTGRETSEFGNRERGRAVNHAVHIEPPVYEPAGSQAIERLAFERPELCERSFRDLTRREFAGERMACQEPLRSVG